MIYLYNYNSTILLLLINVVNKVCIAGPKLMCLRISDPKLDWNMAKKKFPNAIRTNRSLWISPSSTELTSLNFLLFNLWASRNWTDLMASATDIILNSIEGRGNREENSFYFNSFGSNVFLAK